MNDDILADLRLFADLRRAAAALQPLDTLSRAARAKAARDPEILMAVRLLRSSVAKIVGIPPDDQLFWQPTREPYSAAEKRFDQLRAGARTHKRPGD